MEGIFGVHVAVGIPSLGAHKWHSVGPIRHVVMEIFKNLYACAPDGGDFWWCTTCHRCTAA